MTISLGPGLLPSKCIHWVKWKQHWKVACNELLQVRTTYNMWVLCSISWIHKILLSLTKSPFSSVQFSSIAQSCPTLCDPMNCSTPGLPVHHQLREFTQTHVHWVSNAIQPSHPLSSPSPPAPNPSQHQSLFQWVNSSTLEVPYWL